MKTNRPDKVKLNTAIKRGNQEISRLHLKEDLLEIKI